MGSSRFPFMPLGIAPVLGLVLPLALEAGSAVASGDGEFKPLRPPPSMKCLVLGIEEAVAPAPRARLSPEAVHQIAWKFAAELRTLANERAQSALAAHDFEGWIDAMRIAEEAYDSQQLEWIFELSDPSEPYSARDYYDERVSDYATSSKTAAERARLMRAQIAGAGPASSGRLRFTVNRERVPRPRGGGDDFVYRLLIEIPADASEATRALFSRANPQSREPLYLLYEAGVPCANHACDSLFKQLKQVDGQVDSVSADELQAIRQQWYQSRVTRSGPDNFMDPVTREKQNAREYVMRLVMGMYSNETRRIFVPVSLLSPRAP